MLDLGKLFRTLQNNLSRTEVAEGRLHVFTLADRRTFHFWLKLMSRTNVVCWVVRKPAVSRHPFRTLSVHVPIQDCAVRFGCEESIANLSMVLLGNLKQPR